MRHRTFRHMLLCALVLLPVIAGSAIAQGPPPTLVVTDQVTEHEFHDQITLIGRTEAKIHSEIVAEVSGRVTAINAPEGNPIRRGEPLVTIDTSRIVLTLKAKQAEAEQAKQQAFLAEQNRKRVEELFSQNLVPESTIDSARAWAISAEAQYQQLDAQRAELALDLDRCKIRAPYSGYTLRRVVDIGEWVSAGAPVYAMVDLSSITVTVDLPERHFGMVSVGSPVMIRATNASDEVLTGTITGIARSAAAETHTFPIIIDVPNEDGKLGGGKLVRATLNLDNRFTSLAVSKDAIVRDGSRTMVYTINEGQAVPLMVQTGSADGKLISITGEGLAVGMPVVVRGNERIFPGAPVRTAGDQPDQQQPLPDGEQQLSSADGK
ncbi:efflux RND transporter periplasmic adaptor subunit [candidate division GN15 bacterium]|nr:efflux RND transporter periplasmic adaptor subunit [candidate division GN15 bacterium]